MPGRFPKSGRKQSPVNGKAHDQQRANDEPRNTHGKQRKKAAEMIAELSVPDCGVKAEWNADSFGETESKQAEHDRDRQPLPDDVVDAVITVFQRWTEVAMQEIAEISKVL